MTDPRTPGTPGEEPVAADEAAAVDSFATEPPAERPAESPAEPPVEPPVEPQPPAPAVQEPVPAEPAAVDSFAAESPAAVLPTPEPAPVVEPGQPPAAAGPVTAPTAAAPQPPVSGGPVEDVPAERTLGDEDPAVPEPGSSDTVVLPPAPGADGAAGDASDAAPAGRRSRAWLPLAALGAVVALLVGGTGYLAWQLRSEARAEEAREQATAAARDAARLLFSYDHETLEQDFEKGLSVTTGEFREQYQRTTSEVVSPVAEQYDAVVVAEVIEAAIVEASADRVTALVFLNQATTSTRVEGQQVDQSRVRMQLVREDGRWLVEGVGAL